LDNRPDWLKKKININNLNIAEIKNLIDNLKLHTVCQSAKCPNIFECFSKRTATFMLMGNICTRNCAFCGVESGIPEKLDSLEPEKIAKAVQNMGLKYVVLTSVTRDDLVDCGAEHFAKTVRMIKDVNPGSKIECLISDLNGRSGDLKKIMFSGIDVLNHNMETIEAKYATIRPQADYDRSLFILRTAKEMDPKINTKSGFMLGLGETRKDISMLLKDLRKVNCDMVTIGQYLSPTENNYPVKKYYRQEEFDEIKIEALELGFKSVFSGIFVRSSYHAGEMLEKCDKKS